MKIIIHSMAELLELAELVTLGKAPREVRVDHKIELANVEAGGNMAYLRKQMEARMQAQPDGLPDDIQAPTVEWIRTAEVLAAKMRSAPFHVDAPSYEPENDDLPDVDTDGAPYNTDWHSDPAKLTAKGLWRARRGRDEDAYKAWLLSLAVDIAEAAVAADAEPVATETHALPQDAQDLREEVEREAQEAAVDSDNRDESRVDPTVDLQALVAASFAQAASQSNDVRELLNAAQAFTTAHGHAKFNELKSAVAPIDGNPFGKALQLFTPEERQLMMACLANYPSN